MEHLQRKSLIKGCVEEVYNERIIPVSGEPYFSHVEFVAELAAPRMALAYEVGLCHDMLEDRLATAQMLDQVLRKFSYSEYETNMIMKAVKELTDVYTKQAFPEMSKKKRKRKEGERLEKISGLAQTVKYADLIYNINWVVHYKHKEVKRYLRRKLDLLTIMTSGDPSLQRQAISVARLALSAYSVH